MITHYISKYATATGLNGQLHFGSREKRAEPVIAILQAGAAIGGTLIKGINALVDAKSFNTLKMVAANVELQRIHHQYNRYESSLDDTLIGIESLGSGYFGSKGFS